ncbi:hypothetical protein ACIP5T_15525 [Microbacterium sp. NPDC088619]|uniref:hypothetical protein n=1 Tax=Microbacterium sp. NPDC088619 TaxID=3364196 RepID=UPI003817647C
MTDELDPDEPRQKVVRVAGSRRARLTPVVGTDADPERVAKEPSRPKGPKGPNDDRMMQDVPPHY